MSIIGVGVESVLKIVFFLVYFYSSNNTCTLFPFSSPCFGWVQHSDVLSRLYGFLERNKRVAFLKITWVVNENIGL